MEREETYEELRKRLIDVCCQQVVRWRWTRFSDVGDGGKEV